MAKGCSKLNTMSAMWLELEPTMQGLINERINSNGEGSSLLRLLKIYQSHEQVNFPNPLFEKLMSYYNEDGNGVYCFRVCGQCMNITLEDVLYLTGLPIRGKPLVPKDSKDFPAFSRVFGKPVGLKKLTLLELKTICVDRERTVDQRMKAILFSIIMCVIIPSSTGPCWTSYVQFIEKLDELDSYAWGAALLSYLYDGLKRRTKGLGPVARGASHFGIYGERDLKKIGANHYSKKEGHKLGKELVQLARVLESTEVDIKWHPYTPELLPDHLHDQIQCCTFVGPLFCYSHVEYHRPHVVARQFEVLDNIDFDIITAESELKPVVCKKNRGSNAIDFKKHYEKELRLWEEMDRRLAQRYQLPATDSASTSHNLDEHLHFSSSTRQTPHETPLWEEMDRRLAQSYQPPATDSASTSHNLDEHLHFSSSTRQTPHETPHKTPQTPHETPQETPQTPHETPHETPQTPHETPPRADKGNRVVKRRGLPDHHDEPVGPRIRKPKVPFTHSTAHVMKMRRKR
ncbi:Protein MAIN-LIKE 2, partial [Bienertia sinuspersici]